MKNLFLPILVAAVLSALFSSCRNLSSLRKKQIVKDQNALFTKWAQANNGRWLPYTIRSSQRKTNAETKSKILDFWALNLKPVNVAKAYYRKSIEEATGLVDVQLDKYLDSLYLRRYKQINASLLDQKTMDSLFAVYNSLNDITKSKASLSYTKGEATRNYLAGTGNGVVLSIRTDKTSNGNRSSHSNNCIPSELTDWFDQQFNYLYSNIVERRQPYPRPELALYYCDLIREYVSDPCANALFIDFFSAAMGFSVASESGVPTFTDLNCDKARDNVVHQLTAYYSHLKLFIPDQQFDDFADADPLNKSMSEVYVSDYEFTSDDFAFLAQLHEKDQFANSSYNHDLAKATKKIPPFKVGKLPFELEIRYYGHKMYVYITIKDSNAFANIKSDLSTVINKHNKHVDARANGRSKGAALLRVNKWRISMGRDGIIVMYLDGASPGVLKKIVDELAKHKAVVKVQMNLTP